MQYFVRLPSGRTRALLAPPGGRVASLQHQLRDLEGVPESAQRLVSASRELHAHTPLAELAGASVQLHLRVAGGGGDGDMPDWTERGKVSNRSKKAQGTRAPDWHADPAKYAAHIERQKRERGELVVALGPYCVPCGKRFAKQSVYDAHLAGQKHLKALQRLGRTEEAMVCQLDVEAKRRKIAEFEEARDAAGRVNPYVAERATSEEVAARREEREAKLRERAMLAMPSTVAAASVYEDYDEEGGTSSLKVEPVPEFDPLASAAAGSGVSASMAKGLQDGGYMSAPVNKFTSTEMASAHRSLAVPDASFFAPGIHAEEADPPPQRPALPSEDVMAGPSTGSSRTV